MSEAMSPVRIVTLTQQDLEALLSRVVSQALDGQHRARMGTMAVLSPRQVARMAKIRDEGVYSAIECGTLEVTRDQAGRFRISMKKARAWIASLAVYGR